MASADLKEELNCSICLDIYTNPVNLTCGHNFCRACIERFLDSQGGQGVFSCPECRRVFKKRPWLQKNVTLSNIADRFRSTLPDGKTPGVSCTYCIHTAVPAVQSCLHCEASLCDSHLKVHTKSPEHVLIEPTSAPKKWKCSIHNQVLQYYCAVDSACICMSCLQGHHHKHQIQTLSEASINKKDKLKNILTQLTSKRQQTEKRLQGLQEKKQRASDAASAFTARVGDLFRDIRQRLDVLEVQTVENIARQSEKSARPVSELIRQVEVKKDELCSKICHVEELCTVTDPLTVLQEDESTQSDFCVIDKESRQQNVKIEKLDEILISLNLHKELSQILVSVPKALNLPGMSELQLDEETAASNVTISPDLLIAEGTQHDDSVDDTDDRFDSYQVISRTGLDGGRHYWEVEVEDTKSWRIGMAYNSIDRDGKDSVFGNTDESWCLCKNLKGYSFRHNGDDIKLSRSYKRFKRLGIYLNFGKGQLTFYNLEPEVSHLHTFYHKFQEPLHAAIRVAYGVWVKIIQ